MEAVAQDQRLVERCLAAEPAAWEELVRRHSSRVYNLCLRFTGRAADAEDLTQETFVRLFRNLGSYRPEAGSFTAWLVALTRNLLVDHYRRSRHDRQTAELEMAEQVPAPGGVPSALARWGDGHSAERKVWQRELEGHVQRALVGLSPELREAVILRDLQDMDYGEIAAALGVPLGTVKSRINRGRIELARRLRPTIHGPVSRAGVSGGPEPPGTPAESGKGEIA